MKDDIGIREPMVLLDSVELKLESEAGSVNILKGINLRIAAGKRSAWSVRRVPERPR